MKLVRITTTAMAMRYLLEGQMKYMSRHGMDVLMISSDGRERNFILENEGAHCIVPMTRAITPLQDLKSLWKLILLLKREKPDIVHTHTPKAGLLGMLASRICGIQHRIHTIAGLPHETMSGLKRRIMMTAERLTCSCAHQVWPNGKSLLKTVIHSKLCPPDKLKIIGHGSSNGIDLQRFSTANLVGSKLEKIKEELNYDPKTTYLLVIGRVVRDKGVEDVIDVFKSFETDQYNLKLVLVGAYEDSREGENLAPEIVNEIDENPNIILTGWREEIAYFLELSDVLIHASYREGFPNVLLQAGAMGCPVICSDIGPNLDIIQHKISGLVFKVKDREDLKEKIHRALDDPEQLKRMSESLQNKIRSFYDRKIMHELIHEHYQQLMN